MAIIWQPIVEVHKIKPHANLVTIGLMVVYIITDHKTSDLSILKVIFVCLFGVLHCIKSMSYVMVTVHKSMFPGLFLTST